MCKKKNLSWVWGVDRKIRPSRSQSGITRQVIARDGFFCLPLTPIIDPPYITQVLQLRWLIGPRGYKTFFMLNSAEHENCLANKSQHENCLANKSQITNNCKFLLAKYSWAWKFSLLINMKMPTIVGIFIFLSREKFHAQLSSAWKKVL